MKCISLWQPWATLIAIGAKRVETRSWAINHAGLLAIHAAKRWTVHEMAVAGSWPFNVKLQAAGYCQTAIYKHPPLGAIVAVCRVVRVEPVDLVRDTLSAQELAFGNYASGRFAWMLEDIRPLDVPMPWRGRQGPFEVPDDVVESCPADGEMGVDHGNV